MNSSQVLSDFFRDGPIRDTVYTALIVLILILGFCRVLHSVDWVDPCGLCRMLRSADHRMLKSWKEHYTDPPPPGWSGFRYEHSLHVSSKSFCYASTILQFAPLLTIVGWLGGSSCTDGLRWEIHVVYVIALVLAAPYLMELTSWVYGELPLLKSKGTSYLFYLYSVTLCGALDQYSDSMATAIAFACGFSKAWIMLLVFISSWIVQAIAAGLMAGRDELWAALTGVSADALANTATMEIDRLQEQFKTLELVDQHKGQLTDQEQEHQQPDVWAKRKRLEIEIPQTRAAAANKKNAKAILGIVKMLSENIPQAMLQIMLVREQNKSSLLLYASITLSLLLSGKAMIEGVLYFRSTQASLYTPLSEERANETSQPAPPQACSEDD